MEVHRLLSRSEIRVLHLSGTLTLGSIVFFLVMANTLLLPAVKSLRFRQSVSEKIISLRNVAPMEHIFHCLL